ncbi:phosphatase PAP2 family protein [Pinirhizobacter sp.]|jgi:membrane-associated phospholipid phosphatase|uniref:phosphatase PAP2 family protein n=1 Tax=Pinirhizobacter sp. TaxID=2950432 RepID=UPI002F3FE31C
MTIWRAVTSLGDSALLLPLIAWMAIWLFLSPSSWRDARRWLLTVAVCGGMVVLSKVLFMAWGIGPPGLNYTGLSGHTALAIVVWPAYAGILAREASTPLRVMAITLGALVGAGVAVSRLALKVHSPSEVWMGAVLGIAVAAWFVGGLAASQAQPQQRPAWQLLLLAGGALAIGLTCYGRVFPSQYVLQDIAVWLSGHPNVFTRRVRLG